MCNQCQRAIEGNMKRLITANAPSRLETRLAALQVFREKHGIASQNHRVKDIYASPNEWALHCRLWATHETVHCATPQEAWEKNAVLPHLADARD